MARTGNRRYRTNRARTLEGEPVCCLCGQPIDTALPPSDPMSASAHHVVPYARGGTDDLANLRPAHLDCNKRQGDRVDPVIDRKSRAWT
ncbi:HNH endonuclease [Rhodococcus hoagii]|nr:HNH endonuclease [Prescottella equi]MBM4577208.1 HNH endonuclease [Prescottella equi]NKV09759.1 HNH endonuclease [Prescottella equi]